MTSDLDIYRSANELIKQHGDAADIEAAMRADELTLQPFMVDGPESVKALLRQGVDGQFNHCQNLTAKLTSHRSAHSPPLDIAPPPGARSRRPGRVLSTSPAEPRHQPAC